MAERIENISMLSYMEQYNLPPLSGSARSLFDTLRSDQEAKLYVTRMQNRWDKWNLNLDTAHAKAPHISAPSSSALYLDESRLCYLKDQNVYYCL